MEDSVLPSSLLVEADLETGRNLPARNLDRDLYPVDVSGRWPLPAPADEFFDLAVGALCQSFYRSVGPIAHPAGKPDACSNGSRVGAVEDSLHPSMNLQADPPNISHRAHCSRSVG